MPPPTQQSNAAQQQLVNAQANFYNDLQQQFTANNETLAGLMSQAWSGAGLTTDQLTSLVNAGMPSTGVNGLGAFQATVQQYNDFANFTDFANLQPLYFTNAHAIPVQSTPGQNVQFFRYSLVMPSTALVIRSSMEKTIEIILEAGRKRAQEIRERTRMLFSDSLWEIDRDFD